MCVLNINPLPPSGPSFHLPALKTSASCRLCGQIPGPAPFFFLPSRQNPPPTHPRDHFHPLTAALSILLGGWSSVGEIEGAGIQSGGGELLQPVPLPVPAGTGCGSSGRLLLPCYHLTFPSDQPQIAMVSMSFFFCLFL